MTPEDLLALEQARQKLERPSLVLRLTSLLGSPVEGALLALPSTWLQTVHVATRTSLERALQVAVWSLGEGGAGAPPYKRLHQGAAALSGAVGGAVGIAALPVELPLSTALIMRSIAAIARHEGELVTGPEGALACMEVFALGPDGRTEELPGRTYFTIRAALAQAVNDATRHLSRHGLGRHGAPALVRLIAAIGARFGVVVSQKVAAQSLPLLGGVGGATINALFLDFYQQLAEGHFTIRRLERTYGAAAVRRAYEAPGTLLLPPPSPEFGG